MDKHKNYLEKWLRDAYAMEKAAIEILEKQAKYLREKPAAREKIRDHLEESMWQADEVMRCLAILNVKPSGLKTAFGKATANLSAFINADAEDETLKNLISTAAFEQMEIASYRSLMVAAEEYGHPEIRESCRKILEQEQAMARWCEENIESSTVEFLSRHEVFV
jgi:ferritin-like metal-binding protein YciE